VLFLPNFCAFKYKIKRRSPYISERPCSNIVLTHFDTSLYQICKYIIYAIGAIVNKIPHCVRNSLFRNFLVQRGFAPMTFRNAPVRRITPLLPLEGVPVPPQTPPAVVGKYFILSYDCKKNPHITVIGELTGVA
jgi:hypothetical protein